MFIYSIRAQTLKFIAFILIVAALVVGICVSGADSSVFVSADGGEIDYGNIKTNEDRVEFIESFGIRLEDSEPIEEAFTMPENFDRIILGYNELQKKQGLDLSKYAKKRVTRYTYNVINYDHDGEVHANLFVYRGRIVACDISSADPEGFVAPLTLVEKSALK